MSKNEPPAERAREMLLAVELDVNELACRILEAQAEERRPRAGASVS